MKKVLSILLALLMVFSLAACANNNGGDSENEGGEEAPAAEKEQMLYYCAWLGDFGLYDLGHSAAKAVADKYDMDLTVVEYGQDAAVAVNTYLDALENKHYDYVLGLGWYIDGVAEEAAGEYPDTKFVYFDTSASVKYEHDNIYGVSFAQNEGGFLVAVYNALMSKTGKIAIINAGDGPIFNDFGTGWLAGAKYAMKDMALPVDYEYAYVTDSSASGWYESTATLLDKGFDAFWPISSINMLACAQAVEAKGGLEAGHVVGCDYDQWEYYENVKATGGEADGYNNIATSMTKNIPACVDAIFNSIKGNGNITPGNRVYGIADGGVGIVMNSHYEEITPEDVKATINDLMAKVSSGEIDVPSFFDFGSVEAFEAYRDNHLADFAE